MRLRPHLSSAATALRRTPRRRLAAGLAFGAVTAWAGATTWYIAFHDDVLAGLMARQGAMQYAYEERIGTLKVQLERLNSQRLLDEEGVRNRLVDLARRQEAVEGRQQQLTALAAQAADGTSPAPVAPPRIPVAAALPSTASAYIEPTGQKPFPEPDGLGLRGFDTGPKPRPEPATERQSSLPFSRQVSGLVRGLDDLDARQGEILGRLLDGAAQRAVRLKAAVAEAGLSLSRFDKAKAEGLGGPYVPVTPGVSFESDLLLAQRGLAEAERLRQLTGRIPLQRPTNLDLGISSPFGYRTDPFTRGLALHTGTDLRAEYGAPVRATAAGRVVSAEYAGGYGNMVEVDHGNGLVTRYGHLSAFAVAAGQTVKAGQIVGRVGSTGRSTGAHLHYETRIDGEPVDPQRFLRAGARLFGAATLAVRSGGSAALSVPRRP